MGKTTDFNKLRKKRQRRTTARRFLILLAVAVAIVSAVLINDYFIEIGITTRIRDLVDSYGGSGYPVPTPGGILRDVRTFDGDLAVLNDTNLYIYNSKGKVVSSYQQMRDSTVLLCGGQRAMTYDVGGRRLAIHSRSREMWNREMENSVLAADMNERGDFVVATSSQQYVAQVTAYDRQFEECFWWYSSENLVSGVAVSPSGNRMVVGCVNTQGGVIKTIVYLFDYAKESELAKLEFPDNMPLQVSYRPDGRILILTDRQLILCDTGGAQLSSYAFEGWDVLGIERSADETLLLLQSGQVGRGRVQQLVLLDRELSEKAALVLEGQIRDMALGDRRVFLLTPDGVGAYTKELALERHYPLSGVSRVHVIGSELFCFTQDEISKLEQ